MAKLEEGLPPSGHQKQRQQRGLALGLPRAPHAVRMVLGLGLAPSLRQAGWGGGVLAVGVLLDSTLACIYCLSPGVTWGWEAGPLWAERIADEALGQELHSDWASELCSLASDWLLD